MEKGRRRRSLLKQNISRVLASDESSGTTELRQGRNQPSGPEVVCLADELASAQAIMKSLCALNKSAGIGPAALASVGLGLDNQDCRIKTRGRNTGVILLARIPSALPACLPACRSQGEGRARAERTRERERGSGGRAKRGSTGNNNVEAKRGSSVCRSALLLSAVTTPPAYAHSEHLKCVCAFK